MSLFRVSTPDDIVMIEAATMRDAMVRRLSNLGVTDIAADTSLEDIEIDHDISAEEVALVEAGVPVRFAAGSGAGETGTVDVYVTEGAYKPFERHQPGTWRLSFGPWRGGVDADGIFAGADRRGASHHAAWEALVGECSRRFPSREDAMAAGRRWIDAVRAGTSLDTSGSGIEFRHCPRTA